MSRDRLAASRAQQQQGGNNYPSEQPSRYQQRNDSGNGGPPRRQNPYAQQDDQYEMDNRAYESNTQINNTGGGGGGGGSDDFYGEISSITDSLRVFNDNVARISDLHSRSLNNMDDAANQRNAAQLEGLVDDTSALSSQLKNRITKLAKQGAPGQEGRTRAEQTRRIKEKFMNSIQNYQDVERQYRAKQKSRMERQFKIVKPDATAEEVKAVVNDENGGQIFSQALMNSNRYGESRAAYREVQERHEDIKKIEKTLTELAQLFNDMSILVEQQDPVIDNIQMAAETADKDLEAGNQHVEKAVDSARAARKKRWICFFILLAIAIVLAAVLAIEIPKLINNNKKPAT